MGIDLVVILRAIAYGVIGVFAYISRSVLATCAAIVLFFSPIVQEYGSRSLVMKFSLLTTLVAVMLIYRVVRYETELRRLVLILTDAKPKESEMPRYHVKQFGKTMGAALACAFLIMLGLVVKDLVTTTPANRDKQPLPVSTPAPSPTPPPVEPGLVSPSKMLFERSVPPPTQNNAVAPVSGGQTNQSTGIIPPPAPILQQTITNLLGTTSNIVNGILKP